MKTKHWAPLPFLIALVLGLATAASVTACDDDDDDDYDYGDDDAADDDDDTSGGITVDVSIDSMAMDPDPVSISAGDTVRWTNNDLVPHAVTSGDPGDGDAGSVFESGTLGNGATFSFTFDIAGMYRYFCSVHPGTMNGFQVIVGP